MTILIYLGIGVACTAAVCLFLKICDMTGIDGSFVMAFVFASILFALIAYRVHTTLETPQNTNTQIESEVQAE